MAVFGVVRKEHVFGCVNVTLIGVLQEVSRSTVKLGYVIVVRLSDDLWQIPVDCIADMREANTS